MTTTPSTDASGAAPAPVARAAAGDRFLEVSTELLGYSAQELTARPIRDFIHPDDRPDTVSALGQTTDGAVTARFVTRYLHRDGTPRTLSWSAGGHRAAPSARAGPALGSVLGRDRRGLPGRHSGDGPARRRDHLRPRTAERLLGLRRGLQEIDAEAEVHPEDGERLLTMLRACSDLREGQVQQLRYRVRAVGREWRWLSRRLTSFQRDGDVTTQVLSALRDVTDVVAAEDKLNHAALHDPLTGLPNRSLLADRLRVALARTQREGRQVAVLYCDLDGVTRINDGHGHAAGDAVLVETAKRLRTAVRPQDTVARVGGDEFVVLAEIDAETGEVAGSGGAGRKLP